MHNVDENGLKLDDVQHKDQQNWTFVQCICHQKIIKCLIAMKNSQETHRKHILDTEMYLQICGHYIDVFIFQVFDLPSGIVLGTNMLFFL